MYQRYTLSSYVEIPKLEIQPRDKVSWLMFVIVFLSPSIQMLGHYSIFIIKNNSTILSSVISAVKNVSWYNDSCSPPQEIFLLCPASGFSSKDSQFVLDFDHNHNTIRDLQILYVIVINVVDNWCLPYLCAGQVLNLWIIKILSKWVYALSLIWFLLWYVTVFISSHNCMQLSHMLLNCELWENLLSSKSVLLYQM